MELFGGAVYESLNINQAQKVINFGWGLMILIIIASYTANLAAHLTNLQTKPYYKTMEDAIAGGARICAMSGLKGDASARWPRASFVYMESLQEITRSFEADDCDAVASGLPEIRMAPDVLTFFCEHNLVSSGIIVQSIPIGMPAAPDIVGGLSHWIRAAESEGIRYLDFLRLYEPPMDHGCSLEIKTTVAQGMLQLTVTDMFFCFALLAVCILLSVVVKLCGHRIERFGIGLEISVRVRFIKKLTAAEQKLVAEKSKTSDDGQEADERELCDLLGDAFDKWDANEDGELSMEELREGLANDHKIYL